MLFILSTVFVVIFVVSVVFGLGFFAALVYLANQRGVK